MASMLGGCSCGAVRYSLSSAPFDAGWCHCRTCQLTSGGPAMAFATVPIRHYRIERGAEIIKRRASSSFGHRTFCKECGSPLSIQVDYQPETIDLPIATLDEPDAVVPEFHIFWSSKVSWFPPDDDLPTFERFRPNTVGLDRTEPPE
ncbi:MAG: GFA family protein [Sphingomicrobium sp.]|nr:GFA family protein [Sphingomonadales bacterium]